jgi:ribosome-associated heat shock protein Hsp15
VTDPPEDVRLDIWLDVSCLFRTRSAAKHACTTGRIEVNGQPAKPHRTVRIGDAIVISRPFGRQQTVVVRGLADRSIPKAEAQALYDDHTPPPDPEELEIRRLDRVLRSVDPVTRPTDKRARRALRKLRGR